MTSNALRAWHAAAAAVFLFAIWITYALVAGQLDPLGSPAYGFVVEWRTQVLLMLLASLEILAIGDAIVLGLRHRKWAWWAALGAVALFHPLSIVIGMGQLDAWRHDKKTVTAAVVAATGMMTLLGLTGWLRRWAYRAPA